MRVWRKLSISVGLVNVPVSITNATMDNRPHGSYVTPEGKSVSQFYRDEDGNEFSRGDLNIAYPVLDGEYCDKKNANGYVVMGNSDLAALKPLDKDTINLEAACSPAEIDPLYYEASYAVWPQERAAEPGYDLLCAALKKTKLALVGKVKLTTTERIVVLRYSAAANCLIMHLCSFEADIRFAGMSEIGDEMDARKVEKQHLALAQDLIKSLAMPFEGVVGGFTDDYAKALIEAIKAKAEGKTFELPVEAAPAVVPDIAAALKATIAERQAA